MFIYNYRAFDRYNVDVVSLAILADANPTYRPNRFEVAHWGFRCLFEFPAVKLLDYRPGWERLEKEPNPFAVVVMAHLKHLETRAQVDERLFWKVSLVKALYERGYSRGDILRLYKFIDGLIALPEELRTAFHQEIVRYEEARKVTYITTAERIGFEKGVQQGIQQGLERGIQQGFRQGLLKAIEIGLELKFGSEGLRLYPEIRRLEDPDMLEAISEGIKVAQQLAEVERIYKSDMGVKSEK